jgi:hypothetical protein
MQVVTSPIALHELKTMAQKGFGVMVKAVVDVERGIMAIDGELHADEEACLLGEGSSQEHLWGINLYPDLPADEWIEFDSMINLKPRQGNRTRGVDSPETRTRIRAVVTALVAR